MKVKIELAITGCREDGAIASLFNEDDGDMVNLVLGKTPAKTCKEAACKLRLLAARFDILAEQEKPFNSVTQNAVNMGRRR